VDISLCLNPNSFPAASAEQAYQLFEDSWQGVLALYQSGDRYLLYLDTLSNDNLYDFCLAESFTYDDFLNRLMMRGERDLYSFLTQLEDKSPALDHLDAETLDDIASYSFYMPDHPVPKHADTFSLAYFLDAILLSINTTPQWANHQVTIARVADDGRYIDEKLALHHIATRTHGQQLFQQFSQDDIKAVCAHAVMTAEFVTWYQALIAENKRRVLDKCKLACERHFQGAKPLFDSLTNSDGIREIRFSAYSGGAIRILFKAMSDTKHAILLGFIKKSNSEGYDENIPKAEKLFRELQV
jgi:hypothetical protein